jgi:2-haloalkanoic acid dehalogenase type II
MRPFEAIIFDLGSTLIYFDNDWEEIMPQAVEALYSSLVASGMDLDREMFLKEFNRRLQIYYQDRESDFIEYTTQYVLSDLLQEWGFPPSEDALREAVESMYRRTEMHWRIEESTLKVLVHLKQMGYHLGLISNSGDDSNVHRLVDNAKVRPYFDMILTSAGEGIRKPNPRIFQIMLDQWGLKADQVAMVGDTLGADILGARNAGIFSIWVTRWADTSANRAHADTIHPDAAITRLDELPKLLDELAQSK